jgi:hypothetical protein
MEMRSLNLFLVSSGALAMLSACDPKTPVQTSDITTSIDQKITAHDQTSTAHTNLVVSGSQISDKTIAGGKLIDGTVTGSQIQDGAIDSTKIAAAAITAAAMGLLNALLQVLIAFGISISDAQNVAITAFANALLVVVALVLERKTNVLTPSPPKPGV